MACTDEDTYTSNGGKCCDLCPAGTYKQADCDGTKATKCAECGRGFFTATKNYLSTCRLCKNCNSNNHLRKVKECTAQENTVCECETGFYCSDDDCDHCQAVNYCILDCHWMLPAVLWSGLVLTTLVLFGLICWRKKCKSYGEGSSGDPVNFVDVIPAPPVIPLGLTLPSTEVNGHCQESCTIECYRLPLFNPGVDTVISCSTQDSVESSLPITPLKVSVSFAESNHTSAGCDTSNFFRTYSEPQEDEYCGT
ncbi:hypothetical protein L3Q82_002408 [Scortum barcoo]|uniref:Uncharacterized protein n=1 Tax=Scortum barcoo TaxID=214431 RepID=A0ACB8VYL9_9TELE|nr:hypothetical protein L3Q82_002408 [Scortum barcoo]